MNIATLGVAIDPTPAQTGAATANKALDSVADHAERTEAAVGKMNKGAGGSMSAFGGIVQKVVGYLSQLSAFMPGLTGLMAQFTTGAMAAATALAETAASGGALLLVLAPLAIGIGAVVAALAALAAGSAFAFKAIGAAADIQKLTFQFQVLLGSVDKAQQRMAELNRFAAETPFELPEVVKANKTLEVLSEGVLSTIPKMTMIGDAASFVGQRFDDFAITVGRVYAAIQGGRPLGDEAMRLQEVGAITPKVRNEIEKLQKAHADAGKIWELVEKSLLRFSGTMQGEAHLWAGLMSTIRDDWRLLLAAFGQPLVQALTPALQALADLLPTFEDNFRSAGLAVAEAGAMLVKLFKNGDLAEAFWLAFKIKAREAITGILDESTNLLDSSFVGKLGHVQHLLEEMLVEAASIFINTILEGFQNAVALLLAAGDTVAGKIENAFSYFTGKTVMSNFGELYAYHSNAIGGGTQADLKASQARFDKAFNDLMHALDGNTEGLKLTFGGPEDQAKLKELLAKATVTIATLPAPSVFAANHPEAAATAKEAQPYSAPIDKGFKSDAELISDLKYTLDIIQQMMKANQLKPVEASRRMESAKDATVKDLQDPVAARAQNRELISQWQAFEAERVRIAEDAERRIRAGGLTTAEVFKSAFDDILQKWGNMQQQMKGAIVDITQSIANNLSSALTALVTGTKSAKDAFRDMAVAILNDIAKIIIQMLVQLAIQAALRALGYGGGVQGGGVQMAQGGTVSPQVSAPSPVGGGGSSPVSTNAGNLDMTDMGGWTLAGGGNVRGGRGGIDDVPAWLTAGEYVIPKDVVQYYGQDFFDHIRERKAAKHYAEGGLVGVGSGGGNSGGAGIHVEIHVDASSKTSSAKTDSSDPDGKKKGEKLGREFETMTMQILQREQRPGGILHR